MTLYPVGLEFLVKPYMELEKDLGNRFSIGNHLKWLKENNFCLKNFLD